MLDNDFEWQIVKSDGRYIVYDNYSLKNLVSSITVLNPGKSTSGHSHIGQEEVYVFFSGSGKMQIDKKEYSVNRGDVIPVSDGAFHRVFNESDHKLEFAAIFNGLRKS
tara:strand:+ start:1907 stop:2230 length:324 start_codon:yes stop_codon:yes gene_type:complete